MEEKMNSLREFDETYEGTVLGVDEAGRGPLAGAVVAGAVIIPEYFSELDEINDSNGICWLEIDKINIDNASPLLLKLKQEILNDSSILEKIEYKSWKIL